MSIDSLTETKRLLFRSCKNGYSATVQQLLTRHPDLRAQINSLTDDDGNTFLIIASENGRTGIVKLLLECGANIDHRNSRGWTALLKASKKGDSKLETIELLLKHGAQVDLQNDDGESALMVAAQNSQAKLATKLVQKYGASVGLKQEQCNWTALMEASESGSINIVKLLIEYGADGLGWALVLAILNKHNGIIELLLEHGAQVDDKNWDLFFNHSPLVAAVKKGDADVVKLLIEHGAKQEIDQAITNAIIIVNKNAEIIKILSEQGAQVDEMDKFYPPLVKAVEKGDADAVKLLLEHGAKQGIDWAMTSAILSKNVEIIKMLSERGAQVGEDEFDLPPLLVAVETEDADIVKWLLEHGAKQGIDLAMTDAILSKNAEIIKMLSERGAQVDEDWSDPPSLVEAVETGDADIVKLLLEHGAKQGIGWAMTNAIRSEQAEIIQMLSEHGAQVNDELYDNGVGEEPDLVTACKNGNTNVVKLLLEHGAKKYRGWALTEAILNKHTEVVDLLLEHGVCVADEGDRTKLDQDPAIVEASEIGDTECLKLLLKYGEKEQYQDDLGWALSKATTLEIFKLLLDSGAEMDEIDHDGTVPLVLASEFGNTGGVKLMLSHGAKKYLPEALVGAIANKHTDLIELLTQHGAHVDDESWFDFDEVPILVYASMWGNIETVKLLSKYGAEKNLDWALEAASKGGHAEIINFLFNYGVEVDDCDMFDTAALVEASRNGKTDTVRFLLEQLGIMNRLGLALRAASGEGHLDIVHLLSEYGNADDLGYALIEASRSGHTEVIKFLIKCDVFVDFQDKEQTIALIVASQNGNVEAIKLLVELGSNINLQNENGLSALMAACQNHHKKAAKVLLAIDYVALVNMQDNNGVSALMIVSQNSDIKIAKLLLAYGAYVDLQNVEGWSPLMKASHAGHACKNGETTFETWS